MARKKNRRGNNSYSEVTSGEKSNNGSTSSASDVANPAEDFYSDDNVLGRARDNIPAWYSYFSENIERFRANYAFALGNQHSGQDQAIITRLKKSNLVFNKIHEYANRICGHQTKSGANFRVRPINAYIPQERVTLRADLLRGTYDESNGDIEFGRAFTDAVYGCFGAIEIYSDYESDDTFNQRICIEAKKDPTLTFFDINAKEITFSDGDHGGEYYRMKRADFDREYPDQQGGYDLPMSGGNTQQFFDWGSEDFVTICKYYEVRKKKTKLYMLLDERHVYKEEYDADEVLQQIPILNKRDVIRKEWWCYHITSHAVLKKEKTPGNRLPLLLLPAEIYFVEGRAVLYSLVDFARDPQILYNYTVNEIADSMKLRRREVWLTPTTCIPNNAKQIWRNPEYRQGSLPYVPGLQGEKPERLSPEELPQTLFSVWNGLERDIQSGVGMFDANRGEGSGYESRVAIDGKATLGDVSNAKIFQHLNLVIAEAGRIILGMQPEVMDNERYAGMVDENGKHSVKRINSYEHDSIDANHKFDVRVEAGATFELQKQAALEIMIKLFSLPPEILTKYGDLLVQNLDLENAPQIMKRIQFGLDPQVQALEKGEKPPPVPPNPIMLLKQKELQLAEQNMGFKEKEIQLKVAKLKLDQEDMMLKHDGVRLKTRAEINRGYLENQGKTIQMLATLMKNDNIRKSVK